MFFNSLSLVKKFSLPKYVIMSAVVLQSTICSSVDISFTEAVKSNNLAVVKNYIEIGANVNAGEGGYIDFHGDYTKTYLMMAAERGFVAMMKLLIDAGADVNAIEGWDWPHAGSPVLRYAIDGGLSAAVQLLLDAGAQAELETETGVILDGRYGHGNERNTCLLSYAVFSHAPIEIVQALLAGGADVNQLSYYQKFSPLQIAVFVGNKSAAEVLIAAGANLGHLNQEEWLDLKELLGEFFNFYS